jgi:hypothetical protein
VGGVESAGAVVVSCGRTGPGVERGASQVVWGKNRELEIGELKAPIGATLAGVFSTTS